MLIVVKIFYLNNYFLRQHIGQPKYIKKCRYWQFDTEIKAIKRVKKQCLQSSSTAQFW